MDRLVTRIRRLTTRGAAWAAILWLSIWVVATAVSQDRGYVQMVSLHRIEGPIGLMVGPNPMYESTWAYHGPPLDIEKLSQQLQTVVAFECSPLCSPHGDANVKPHDLRAELALGVGDESNAHWQVLNSAGQTDVVHGVQKTVVAVSAPIPTSITLKLRLSMIVTDPDLVSSGNYQSTVTTSITSY